MSCFTADEVYVCIFNYEVCNMNTKYAFFFIKAPSQDHVKYGIQQVTYWLANSNWSKCK